MLDYENKRINKCRWKKLKLLILKKSRANTKIMIKIKLFHLQCDKGKIIFF